MRTVWVVVVVVVAAEIWRLGFFSGVFVVASCHSLEEEIALIRTTTWLQQIRRPSPAALLTCLSCCCLSFQYEHNYTHEWIDLTASQLPCNQQKRPGNTYITRSLRQDGFLVGRANEAHETGWQSAVQGLFQQTQ